MRGDKCDCDWCESRKHVGYFRITIAHAIWLVSDWLESAREACLRAAGKVAGL